MNSKKKIFTILPYKENYSLDTAAAASLWVAEFFKKSKYKSNNIIIGSTDDRKYLTKNYLNITPKNIMKKFLSTTNLYCDKILDYAKKKHPDLIEIHNRPNVLNYLSKKIKTKFIIYFHNNPQTMNGSKSISERLNILKNVEKIIFVSNWTKNKFFEGIDEKLTTKSRVIYPSVNKIKKFKEKDKKILFVGKLNSAKGYDLFRDSIIKILDKFPEWNAYSIGNESRNKPIINHKRHEELGYLSHQKVLAFINKCSIVTVPSKWEEPFGRVALEASSRGCATIVSNRGGLPETTDHSIKINTLTSDELYKTIKDLIINPKKMKRIQVKSFKNVKHLINNNTILIDEIRDEAIADFKINLSSNNFRILNIYNKGQKLDHRLYNISLGKKFTNGFIRNGHDVLELSDRDFIKQNRSFYSINPKAYFNNHLIETFKNYKPDILFFGHTKNIEIDTIDKLKTLNKNLKIIHWNEDPVMYNNSISQKNIDNINFYSNIVDRTFITSDTSVLKKSLKLIKNLNFFFVPVDKNIECYNVYNMSPSNDIFYAMSHGVNRGGLKSGKEDERVLFLNQLIKKLNNINYDFYGFKNKDPIWGQKFYEALTNSKMALNLSRGNPVKYYSSNRIASLMGNGLLTFIDKKTQINDFFKNDEAIFYENINDLSQKIKFYSNKESLRKKIAERGKKKYFKLFDGNKICKYIIDITFDKDSKLI